MKNLAMCLTAICCFLIHLVIGQEPSKNFEGFFDYDYDPVTGKIWLYVDNFDMEFLYANALSAGAGSNDIGLDRGQLGGERIVRFEKHGPKVLLVEKNYKYRATSDNPKEVKAVEDAFATSVLWGFEHHTRGERDVIDLTPFILRDAHGVANRLSSRKQGKYQVDKSRCAIYLDNTRSFPNNSEFEVIITLTGKPEGGWIRSVTPSPEAITLRMHHSFILLPDAGYSPRKNDPRSGFNGITFLDYAAPIHENLEKRYIRRHRLEKRNPEAQRSEPVEPIVYYLDPGCPEPIKSALLEGASWWNQAFEHAGYINAFRVMELPDGVDPLDVRYNIIHWVHRSTRGWSYGSSISDPRTGEILKGNVLLGSLRVRQDYLIAQGLASIFEEGNEDPGPLVEVALARLRQLAAHEVGHTLGLMHNFAASYNDRASVMDYPHPMVNMDDSGQFDFSRAYDVGIGEWDKRVILYGYQDFPEEVNEEDALDGIVKESINMGLQYISDQDARPAGGAHPLAHLWDNGTNPSDELRRLGTIRQIALKKFGEQTIPEGTPYAYLEKVLVPLYLNHRYQVEAVAKVIGGEYYTYAVRDDGQQVKSIVPREEQDNALNALFGTLEPAFLAQHKSVIQNIPPQPAGHNRHRELFKTYTGMGFDPLAAAESSIEHTLQFLLHPNRLARIQEHYLIDSQKHFSLISYLDKIAEKIRRSNAGTILEQEIQRTTEKQFVRHLLSLSRNTSIQAQVSASSLFTVESLRKSLSAESAGESKEDKAHKIFLINLIDRSKSGKDLPGLPEFHDMPPGSPIGCSRG